MIGKDASMERSQSNKYLKHTIFQENPYQRIQTGSSPLTLADPSLKNTLRLQNNGKPASFCSCRSKYTDDHWRNWGE